MYRVKHEGVLHVTWKLWTAGSGDTTWHEVLLLTLQCVLFQLHHRSNEAITLIMYLKNNLVICQGKICATHQYLLFKPFPCYEREPPVYIILT